MMRTTKFLGRSQARAQRRLEWKDMVFPFTLQRFVDQCTASDARVSSKTAYARSIPKKVEAIDWDAWKKQIKAPGVVEALQKEYESAGPATVVVDESWKEEVAAKIQEVKGARDDVPYFQFEIEQADKKIALMQKHASEWRLWTYQDLLDSYPGMKEQAADEGMNDDWFASEFHYKSEKVDMKELAAKVEAGEHIDYPVPPKDDRIIGDFNYDTENELRGKNLWSVGRLWASKAEQAENLEMVKKIRNGREKVTPNLYEQPSSA